MAAPDQTPGWNIFHDSSAASAVPVELERPNLQRALGWTPFDVRIHASWAKTAVGHVRAVAASSFFPDSVDSADDQTMRLDLSRDTAMARATLDMACLWRCCGINKLVPDLDHNGDIRIEGLDILLQFSAIGGLMRGACDHKPYNQVLGSGWSSSTYTCSVQCFGDACATCKLGLYASCARAQSGTAVQCIVKPATDPNAHTLVEMNFYMAPTMHLPDADYRYLNKWSYATMGVFRDARRANFSSARALASMFQADRNTAFGAYVTKVRQTGWHAKVAQMLSAKGMSCAPYEHQTASVLAMLQMECTPYPLGGDIAMPFYGRGGAGDFLRESMLEVTGSTLICTLTGSIVTKERFESALASTRGGLLALPPGVGKTYTCVALALVTWVAGQSTIAAVIRAPTHLSLQWKREIARFCPSANIVDACVSGTRVTQEQVSSSAGPTFVVMPPMTDPRDCGVACRGGSAHSQFARGAPGVKAQRTFIDEAHEMMACGMAPAEGEATWAVTATPFFSNGASRDALFDVLQKVPRHFGLPKCHGQLLNLFNKDAGTIFQSLTLNLHELQDMLPVVHSQMETIEVNRNDAAFETFTNRLVEHAQRQRDSWMSSRTGLDSMLRMANTMIRLAAQRGLVIHVDELFARPVGHYAFPLGGMQPVERTHFPTLSDINVAAPADSVRLMEKLRDDQDDCVVCLENLQQDLIALPCDHVLHYECLRNWHRTDLGLGITATSTRCAMCRQQYRVADLRKIVPFDNGDVYDDASAHASADASSSAQAPPAQDADKWTFDEVHRRAVVLIGEHLSKNEGKAIVFLNQNSAMRLHAFLRASNISFVNCIEAGSEESRAHSIATFVNGAPDVLLIDPKSETGLNLTVANFVLNYAGHDGSYDQIVGRVRRLGQVHDVRVTQLRVNTVHLRVDL